MVKASNSKSAKRSVVVAASTSGSRSAAGTASHRRQPGRKGKFQKKKGPKHSKDSLDKDLENYMMKDADFAKSKLDNDLDEYMKDAAVTAE